VTKSSTGAPVPTSFYDKVIAILTYISPLSNAGTKIRTASGETLQIPSTSSPGTALIKAEAAAIVEGDVVFNSLVSMSSFKASQLLQVSSELISDNGLSGPDLLGFLAEQIGTSMGVLIDNKLTLGTGTVEPTGIVTSASSGVTGSTASPTADNLIDLVYSVNAAYRNRPAVAFLASTTAIQAIRKLKTTTNEYIFEPNYQVGQPDRLLGFPLLESTQMAAVAAGAKSVIFGDMSQFYIREVGAMELARSDDFAFSTGLVTLRATYRFDSRLIQTSAVKTFVGA
jgi:HK97 family phage major capsid protein